MQGDVSLGRDRMNADRAGMAQARAILRFWLACPRRCDHSLPESFEGLLGSPHHPRLIRPNTIHSDGQQTFQTNLSELG
jgi:hypothetical protein